MEDKESGKIVGKALMPVIFKKFGTFPNGSIHYTISIYVKDGRYKYEITDFYHTGDGTGPDFGTCEDMISTKKGSVGGIPIRKKISSYLVQMDAGIKSLILDLKKSMNVTSNANKNDDW
jgi:hypothetical protein